MTRPASPTLAALQSEADRTLDVRRPLWGLVEALQAVARHLDAGAATALACRAAPLCREALLCGAPVQSLDDLAADAQDLAEDPAAAPLCEAVAALCRATLSLRQERTCRGHLAAVLQALARAIDQSPRPTYAAEVAAHAYALGELRAEEGPDLWPVPPAGEADCGGAVADKGRSLGEGGAGIGGAFGRRSALGRRRAA